MGGDPAAHGDDLAVWLSSRMIMCRADTEKAGIGRSIAAAQADIAPELGVAIAG